MNNALETINADAPKGITGRGVGIAILDTGICPMEDFTMPNNRIAAFKDFVNNIKKPYDDNGHGTHVAGIAAGNGYLSDGKYCGVAYESSIIALKILDEFGNGTASSAINALRWVYKNKDRYNIRVVNLSIGTDDQSISSPLIKAVNALWDSGITVVCAAGNDESRGIASPGISPRIITVGSIEEPSVFKIKSKNFVYYKPDVFAPGENIVSCKAHEFSFTGKRRSADNIVEKNYIMMSGTSMSTPMVSGACALMIQHGRGISPDRVKSLMVNAAYMPGKKGLLNIGRIFYGG